VRKRTASVTVLKLPSTYGTRSSQASAKSGPEELQEGDAGWGRYGWGEADGRQEWHWRRLRSGGRWYGQGAVGGRPDQSPATLPMLVLACNSAGMGSHPATSNRPTSPHCSYRRS
jgi:hypothetical protein